MSIDTSWNAQSVTALDLSAMSASESIVNSSQDTQRAQPLARDEALGGTSPPLLDIAELTTNMSDGPASPLQVSGSQSDYDSGLMRPVAETSEGSAIGLLRESQGASQVDQAFSANLAAQNYTDTYIGRIVDYTA